MPTALSSIIPNASPEGIKLMEDLMLYDPMARPRGVFAFWVNHLDVSLSARGENREALLMLLLLLLLLLLWDIVRRPHARVTRAQARPTASQTLQYPFFQVNASLPPPVHIVAAPPNAQANAQAAVSAKAECSFVARVRFPSARPLPADARALVSTQNTRKFCLSRKKEKKHKTF